MAGLPGPKPPAPKAPVIITPPSYDVESNGNHSGEYQSIEELRQEVTTMIASDGLSDAGKTEFLLSAPGPIRAVCLDRGHKGVAHNQNPPPWRTKDAKFKIMNPPTVTAAGKDEFAEAWVAFRSEVYKLLGDSSVRTVGIEGDSDSYDLQKLAEHGRLHKIMPLQHTELKQKRKAYVHRLSDSGKIIIATSKVKYDYEDKIDRATGLPEIDQATGETKRVKTDRLVTQSLNEEDREYMWQIVIRHMYRPETFSKTLKKMMPAKFGLKILKCKPNKSLEGSELWGDDCNFKSLVGLVYPHIPARAWGYE